MRKSPAGTKVWQDSYHSPGATSPEVLQGKGGASNWPSLLSVWQTTLVRDSYTSTFLPPTLPNPRNSHFVLDKGGCLAHRRSLRKEKGPPRWDGWAGFAERRVVRLGLGIGGYKEDSLVNFKHIFLSPISQARSYPIFAVKSRRHSFTLRTNGEME